MDPTALIMAVVSAVPQAIPYITAIVTVATLVVRFAPAPSATAPTWWKDLYAIVHYAANLKLPPAPGAPQA